MNMFLKGLREYCVFAVLICQTERICKDILRLIKATWRNYIKGLKTSKNLEFNKVFSLQFHILKKLETLVFSVLKQPQLSFLTKFNKWSPYYYNIPILLVQTWLNSSVTLHHEVHHTFCSQMQRRKLPHLAWAITHARWLSPKSSSWSLWGVGTCWSDLLSDLKHSFRGSWGNTHRL